MAISLSLQFGIAVFLRMALPLLLPPRVKAVLPPGTGVRSRTAVFPASQYPLIARSLSASLAIGRKPHNAVLNLATLAPLLLLPSLPLLLPSRVKVGVTRPTPVPENLPPASRPEIIQLETIMADARILLALFLLAPKVLTLALSRV
jgi:hypothetical protein